MSSLNKVMLIGRLGRDPEVKYLETGAAVAKFSIATSESYKDKAGEWQEQTEWHDIILWRMLAERAEKQLKKGSLIYIEGKLTHRKWEDKDGNKRKTTEVVGQTFRTLEKRESTNSGYFPSESDEPATAFNKPKEVNEAKPESKNVVEDTSDDLPF